MEFVKNHSRLFSALVLGIGITTFRRIMISIYQDSKAKHRKNIKPKRKKRKDKELKPKEDIIIVRPTWNNTIFFPCFYPELQDSTFQKFLGYLDYAKVSIKICVMTITDEMIIQFLIKKYKSGVKICIFTSYFNTKIQGQDRIGIGKTNYTGTNRNLLKNAGIQVRSLPKSDYSTEMHHKYAIVDDFGILTGSINWTTQSFVQQRENILVTTDERIVPKFIKNFEYLWGKCGGESSSSDGD